MDQALGDRLGKNLSGGLPAVSRSHTKMPSLADALADCADENEQNTYGYFAPDICSNYTQL